MFSWLTSLGEWSSGDARGRILAGRPPRRMRVAGSLDLANQIAVRALPEKLSARSIDLSGCANLRALPQGIECQEIILRGGGVENLPAGLRAHRRIDAQGCRRLRSVGAYRVDELILRGCIALETLPEGLEARRLDVSRCPLMAELPTSVLRCVEFLDVSECPQWKTLPALFARLEGLNVGGCANLAELPEGIRIRSWIDVAGSGLTALPWSLRSVRVLWRGVQVSDQVAFDPLSITVEDVLDERNQAVRGVMLERMGMDRLIEQASAAVVDQDRDAGGIRRLLRIEARGNEPIVCIQVQCPSTGGRYLLRVPPDVQTCQQAVAWTAGYRNPKAYRPVVET